MSEKISLDSSDSHSKHSHMHFSFIFAVVKQYKKIYGYTV